MSKWDPSEKGKTRPSSGNVGSEGYTPRYARVGSKFSPKRVVRSFRDLDVYRIMMECSITVGREVLPILTKDKFSLTEGMQNCALSIPLHIAEAHGMRFSNFDAAVATLEKAMLGCNKMIVYLEEAAGLCPNFDSGIADSLSQKYINTRGKMLRLERSWQKFRAVSPPFKKP